MIESSLTGRSWHHRNESVMSDEFYSITNPTMEICTRNDPEGRPTVFDKLPPLKHGRWVSVGRLDLNTSGLLLFTTDGELANKLMHPSSEIEREYAVRVMGDVTQGMVDQMHAGLILDGALCRFTDVQYFAGEGLKPVVSRGAHGREKPRG